jgi:hypothetical protein
VVRKAYPLHITAAEKLKAHADFELRCFGYSTKSKNWHAQDCRRLLVRNMATPIPVAISVLITKGVELSNQLHDHLCTTDNLTRKWNHKFMFLALMGYAASMAKFSELDKADYMALAEGFYDNIDMIPKDGSK